MSSEAARSRKARVRAVLGVHVVFALACVLGITIGRDQSGRAILLLTLIYNAALPLWCLARRDRVSLSMWRFLLPLSVLMILPDAFLSAHLGVLVFPDTGSPFLGSVPVFMAGLWVIPLFLVLHAGESGGLPGAALASCLVFTAAEATLWAIPVWHAINVTTVAHVAVYLLVPETVLGLSAWLAWRQVGDCGLLLRLTAAFAVMTLYLGNVALFWFLVEFLPAV